MLAENPLFALLLTLIAILCVRLTFHFSEKKTTSSRFVAIDGLRGYLAFFVFLHHAMIWSNYSQTGIWKTPDSHIYTHLGQSSVALFFMISSFLFYDKILISRSLGFNWRIFFVGRFFRLAPLYLTVIILVFAVVAILSDGDLKDSPRYLLFCAVRWLTFTVMGAPDINQVDAFLMVGGVTWSLPYEWCFYLILPLIALMVGHRPSMLALAISGIGLATAWFTDMHIYLGRLFLGGLIAAHLVRSPRFNDFSKTPWASAIVLSSIFAVQIFPTAYTLMPFILLTIAFCLIAAGSDIFGMLATRTSHRLGDIAYSIYLLHGILLFLTLNFVVGKNVVATMCAMTYWAIVACLVPILLALSSTTFNLIENPGIYFGKKVNRYFS